MVAGRGKSKPVVKDVEETEPMCRICMALVHLDCLNQWRATSSEAFYKCFICRYYYRINQCIWAKVLASRSPSCLTIMLLVVISLIIGWLLLLLPSSNRLLPAVLLDLAWPDYQPIYCLPGVRDRLVTRMLLKQRTAEDPYLCILEALCFSFMSFLRCSGTFNAFARYLSVGFMVCGAVGQLVHLLRAAAGQRCLHLVLLAGFYGRSVQGALRVWVLLGLLGVFWMLRDWLTGWLHELQKDEVLEVVVKTSSRSGPYGT